MADLDVVRAEHGDHRRVGTSSQVKVWGHNATPDLNALAADAAQVCKPLGQRQ